jgi:hypothetical protein
VKEALNEEIHHTETYPPQDLIAWIKETYEQEQQERAQTTPHNEHKHQNKDQTRAGRHKLLTHWIYHSHPFCSDGQKSQHGMPVLRNKSNHRPHSMAL